MTELWTVEDDGRLRLHLHPGQSRAWASQSRFTFVLAGTQSGKTSFGPWWLWREVQRWGERDREGRAGDFLTVSGSFDLFKLKLLPELRDVLEDTLGVARYWSGDRILELRPSPDEKFWARRADDGMWGRIILRSAASRGGLESATARAAWLDECGLDGFGLDDWEAVQRRLSLAQGRVLGTTTLYNRGWIKTEVYDRWKAGDRDYNVIQFPSFLNPQFPMAEYLRVCATQPDWKVAMQYRGEFARPPGLIYAAFDELVHVVAPYAIPDHWRRWVGVDFGGVNTAVVFAAQNPASGAYYVYDELLLGDATTACYAGDVLKADGRVTTGWGGAPSEGQYRRDWTAAGLPLRKPPVGDFWPGVDRVAEALTARRLFVFSTCRGLVDEFARYKRKTDEATGEVLDEVEDKAKFHRLDALRYLMVGLLGGGSAAVV